MLYLWICPRRLTGFHIVTCPPNSATTESGDLHVRSPGSKPSFTTKNKRVSVNDQMSSWVDVSSSVPQGSVLGPTLFLLYINHIQCNISSRIRLFADDSIVYWEIYSDLDHTFLQQNLQALDGWSKTGWWISTWRVSAEKRNPFLLHYFILGQSLSRITTMTTWV